jgi:hypothetical protein
MIILRPLMPALTINFFAEICRKVVFMCSLYGHPPATIFSLHKCTHLDRRLFLSQLYEVYISWKLCSHVGRKHAGLVVTL